MKSISPNRLRRTALAAAAFLAFGGVMAAHAAGPVSDAEMRQFADRANFTAISAQVKYTRYIITYAQGSAERTQATARQHDYDRVAAETGLNVAHIRTLSTGAELVEVSGDKLRFAAYDESARQVLASFARNAAVEYVDPDRIMHALLTPNDTNFGSQWDLTDPTGGVNQTGAWDIATGSGIKVAVIDTGITPHTDLSGQTVGGYDFISSSTTARDGNGRDANPNDEGDWYASNECGVGIPGSNSSWHGTHVAGTVAALTNNASGVASMAYGAKVVPVRVLGKCGGTVADIVDAITWASGGTVSGVPANTNSAKVLSLSLGGGGACGSFQAAITGARSRGSVFVVAAGNENQNVTNSSPANCSGVISVAATTRAGARASYSNFGSTIVISAPGGAGTGGTADILSTLNTGTTTQGSQTYAYYAGTSMATPHVSALAAAIFSINSGLTPDQVKNYITANARPLPGSCSGGCGAGIINAQATLAAVSGGGSNVAPTANFSFTTSGLTANFTDTSTDSDGTIASRSWNFGDGGTSTATNPSHAYAAGGTYSVALTVTDDDGAPNTRTQSVTVSGGGGGTVLQNNVPVTGLAATTGNALTYTMTVPAGATNLVFQISGGTGDADMYVRYSSAPGTTAGTYDCRPYLNGNNETCTFASPTAGTWYVTLRAYSSFTGVTLRGSYNAGGGGGTVLQNNVPVTGLAATTGNSLNYTMTVPAGATNLQFRTSGGTGDADLYVRFNAAPTTSTYTCRSWANGNTENCTIAAPQAGTWYVMVRAYTTFSGVTLTGSYTP